MDIQMLDVPASKNGVGESITWFNELPRILKEH